MAWKVSPLALAMAGLAVGVSSVHANAVEDCFRVYLPTVQPGFVVSATALALKPGASNLNYAIYNKALPLQSPSWTEKELKPNYDAGFAVSFGYLFADGKDVTVDWTHLDSNTSSSIAAPNSEYFIGPDFQIGPDSIPVRAASGKARFDYDVVNVNGGQTVNFGSHMTTRFFGGLSNPYLRERVTATFTGNVVTAPNAGPFSTRQRVSADFTGVGPRMGLESNYEVGYGFGIIGEAAVSALIGSNTSKTSYLSSSQELLNDFGQTSNYQTIKDDNITQVIPAIDAKIGLSYSYAFCNGEVLTVKGGYQAAVYVDAINQYIPQTVVQPIQSGGIFVGTMSHTVSDYSVQGFFL